MTGTWLLVLTTLIYSLVSRMHIIHCTMSYTYMYLLYICIHVHVYLYGMCSSDGQRGTPGKRKRGPTSSNNGSGGPKLKQPKLLDCLFDDEDLSPIQVKGATCCTCVPYFYTLYQIVNTNFQQRSSRIIVWYK